MTQERPQPDPDPDDPDPAGVAARATPTTSDMAAAPVGVAVVLAYAREVDGIRRRGGEVVTVDPLTAKQFISEGVAARAIDAPDTKES